MNSVNVTPRFYRCANDCIGCARKATFDNDEGYQYNDGEWYHVTVRRRGINGTLQLRGNSISATGNFKYLSQSTLTLAVLTTQLLLVFHTTAGITRRSAQTVRRKTAPQI